MSLGAKRPRLSVEAPPVEVKPTLTKAELRRQKIAELMAKQKKQQVDAQQKQAAEAAQKQQEQPPPPQQQQQVGANAAYLAKAGRGMSFTSASGQQWGGPAVEEEVDELDAFMAEQDSKAKKLISDAVKKSKEEAEMRVSVVVQATILVNSNVI